MRGSRKVQRQLPSTWERFESVIDEILVEADHVSRSGDGLECLAKVRYLERVSRDVHALEELCLYAAVQAGQRQIVIGA